MKATFGSTTLAGVGNYYERDNGTTVRKYYYAGTAARGHAYRRPDLLPARRPSDVDRHHHQQR